MANINENISIIKLLFIINNKMFYRNNKTNNCTTENEKETYYSLPL